MKAISVRQPWAWLIVNGYKDIENRSRNTKHRGEIIIHAAKGMTCQEYLDCKKFVEVCVDPKIKLPKFEELERGGVVGIAEIVDSVSDHSSPWFEGPKGYVLKNARKLPFKKINGNLGVFHIWD